MQILDDMQLENTFEDFSLTVENFEVISHREDSRMLRVANSPRSITVTIADNDGDTVIGFEEPEFSVGEDTSLELCVVVMRPTVSESFDAVIDIIVATVSGSAGMYAYLSPHPLPLPLPPFPNHKYFSALIGPSDYIPISAVDRDVVLRFNNSTRRACFMVSILRDMLFEGPEVFTVQLTPQIISIGTSQGVSLSPSIATITIIEAQLPFTIGFEDSSLSRMVQETVGSVSLCVRVFGEGELTRSFGVNVDIGGGGNAGEGHLYIAEGACMPCHANLCMPV